MHIILLTGIQPLKQSNTNIWIRLGNMRRKQLEQKIYNMWDNIVQKIEKYDLLEIHDDKIEGL